MDGVIDVADRDRMAVRPEPGNLIEGQFRARGDDQIIVVQRAAIGEVDALLGRPNASGADVDELDTLALHHRRQANLDGFALAPAHRHPRIGGREMEDVAFRHHDDASAIAQDVAQFIGRNGSAKACAEDDDGGSIHVRAPSRTFDDARSCATRSFAP